MCIAPLLVYVFLLMGLLLLGSIVWQVGIDGSPYELRRRGLVDNAMGLAGNCAYGATHGWLGRLLSQE